MNEMSEEVHVEPNKPRNKLMVFGGMGCLLLLLLCVGGIGAAYYYGQDIGVEMNNIISAITVSPEVEEEIGSPVTVTPNIMPQVAEVDGQRYTTYTGIVTGPDGEGTFTAQLTNEGVDYEIQSLVVDVNGKQIEVSDEEEMDLGIDLGE